MWEITLNGGLDEVSVVAESARGRRVIPGFRQADLSLFDLPLSFVQPEVSVLGAVFSQAEWDSLGKTAMSIQEKLGGETHALSPIRTNPQRTYDPIGVAPKPDGSHVPQVLAVLSESELAPLRPALKEFGAKSGLFEQIEVIRKGQNKSDPFQIGVKSSGPTFNLVDVGYGVSQALPILVDILLHARDNAVFLLQQPEVHLHPRAQAEMGSFFARQASKNRRFVIETHSDHLVDRIRMEVREKKLRPDDVSLLYLNDRGTER